MSEDLDTLARELRAAGLRLIYLHEVGFDERPIAPFTYNVMLREESKGNRNGGPAAFGNGPTPSAAIRAAIAEYQKPKAAWKPRGPLPDITLEDLDL